MKRYVGLVLILLLMMCAAYAEQDAEMEMYTCYTDYAPQKAEPVGLIPGDNHNILLQIMVSWRLKPMS